MSDDPALTVLTKTPNASIAHLIRSYIETYDIDCFVFDDHPAGIGMGLRDVRVMVSSDDLEKAQKLLTEFEKDSKENNDLPH